MDAYNLLRDLSNSYGVSGYEKNQREIVRSAFETYVDEVYEDKLGNIICLKRGEAEENPAKIYLAAHMDEIGLMVKNIEDNGFLRFTNIGGVDPRTVVGQEVIVHGKENLFGVICSKPPHLQDSEESSKAYGLNDLFIDTGYDCEDVKEKISIGDTITIKREFKDLLNGRITGKSLDDKAGVAAMLQAAIELADMKHEADVYFVMTVQEEIGGRGAIVSTYEIEPDVGIAIDVGFGKTPELNDYDAQNLGEGPAITIGPNIHPNYRKHLLKVADEYNIRTQIEVDPGPTGTDGAEIQISKMGVPTLVISIPLRYMHTSVEVMEMSDIVNTGKLLSFFIKSINRENVEVLKCY